MEIKRGIAVSPGVVIKRAFVIDSEGIVSALFESFATFEELE